MWIGYEDDVFSNTEYVSWWPVGDVWESPAFKRRTFQDDVQDERRKPTWTYRFFGILDERAALDYWTKWKSDVTYRVVTRNCSTCVLSALKAAGITNYITFLNLDPVVPSYVSSVCYGVFSKLTRNPKLYMKPGMSVQRF